jgi:2-polyprenyl-3-methyl-5-hydroxy-6-metoxy-1,4-benzoquinol methylase
MSATSIREKIVRKYITKNNVNVLDIGCGTGEILESLPKVKYFGYDINPIYINDAKKKYKGLGNFFFKKFTNKELKKLPKFDHVLLLGILHHLNDAEVNALMLLLKKTLKKKGNIITLDSIFSKEQNPIAKLLIKMDRGENVRTKDGYLRLIENHFKKINSKVYHQKFIPYTWFVTNCTR